MEFKANRSEFLQMLNISNKAVSMKPDNEINGAVLISLKKDENSLGLGVIRLTSTNFDSTIITVGEVDTIEDGEIAVPAKKLLDIVNAMPEGIVHFKLTDKFVIKSGKSKFIIPTFRAKEFPKVDKVKVRTGVSVKKDDFIRGIKNAAPVVNTTYNNALAGMFLEIGNAHCIVTAASMSRLASTQCSVEPSEEAKDTNAVVPVNLAQNLQKILVASDSEIVKVGIAETQIIVKQDHFVMIINLLSGIYPEYRKMIPESDDNPCVVNRLELLSAINRVGIIATGNSYDNIQLDFAKNKLSVKSIATDNGFSEDEFEIEYTGEDKTIFVSYSNLLKILNPLSSSIIELHIHKSPCAIKVVAYDDKFTGLVGRTAVK